ncbi:4-hydroxybenzoate octaprenyltransferase [Psychrosphaera sp. B3R10]|uniref:4-hydroxybenzoate octaprenyltransferase n=1 Tax=unclassified Psychrosphaera TaxID=2641570 RepID=UPI001C08BAE7|nr:MULTISPECIES: 4-hydroxybenzoate octaprenyltransferase [unclassified Psychrosphaera]MBU2883353.1 4-hydroxybenzoate octaprenyltransferase [Psychrosphaera sp. I2R16]MBU2990553.1 4-hydroxybenzoate octaprenyltransferase [Psychrosphaera sp. B3R10]
MKLLLTFSNYPAYHRLMRMDKPIGIYLLLWPTFWALWIATEGVPSLHLFTVFTLGVIVMRAAGCVINDYADREIDGHVKRTQQRPIPAGEATAIEALQLFVLLLLIAFALVMTLNIETIVLSFGALILASVYPFMKRYTHFPQVVLGAAFSWSIPMAFMAATAQLPAVVWYLYGANLLWTVAYDTYYAMVDKDDDLKLGVKSTAIAFGRFELQAIVLCQLLTVAIFAVLYHQLGWQWPMDIALTVVIVLFAQQLWQAREKQRDACFRAFLANHYVGLVVFIGLIGQYNLLPLLAN